jgi:cysteinyl-tRNA synthetase
MALKIYNTLSGKKEDFVPLNDNKVGMYVCGVTVYDLCHIGHARSAVVFDVIFRYLRHRGFEVNYVRNFTDVDDKIIHRANAENLSCDEIAERYIEAFYTDMDSLGLERPTYEPRATEHIDDIIEIITRLIEHGHAYRVDEDVYFSVESFNGYGRLSGRSLEEMRAGARIEIDERKVNPLDFALWKASKPSEPAWKSPWGEGRPGWHIECSSMSQKYLGESFDIHGGGKDLIFPHHENEIAQSEGANKKPFVRYWIHNGFVNIHQEKMSKSLGNVLNIRDLLKIYHPETLRLFLLSNHYRSPLDFSEEAMKEASSGMDRFYTLLDRIDRHLKEAKLSTAGASKGPSMSMDEEMSEALAAFPQKFTDAMDDDFNSAKAIGHLFDFTRLLNRFMDGGFSPVTQNILSILESSRIQYQSCGEILGFFSEEPGAYFENQKAKGLGGVKIEKKEITKLISERDEARKQKDWARADEIRKVLSERGIVLEDGPDGTQWRLQ